MGAYIELPSGKVISNDGILMVDKVCCIEGVSPEDTQGVIMVLYRCDNGHGSAVSVFLKYTDYEKAVEDHNFLVNYLN